MLTLDFAPTILELAGVAVPDGTHGRSLVPLLRGQTPTDWRTSFLVEYYSDTVMPRLVKMGYKAVRTSRWKYIRYVDVQDVDELYDLQNDPYEMRNVIADPGAQTALAAMRQELHQLLADHGPVSY